MGRRVDVSFGLGKRVAITCATLVCVACLACGAAGAAPAWAQTLQAGAGVSVQAAGIDEVRALIEDLPGVMAVTEEDGERIAAARSAYDALTKDEQRLLDTETNRAALGITQSYGRALELAEAGYAVLHAVDNSTSLADGVYATGISTSWNRGKSASKQDRDWVATSVRVEGGKAFVTLSVNSPTYSYVRASGIVVQRASASGSEASVFEFPVSLGKSMVFNGYSQTMATEIAYNLVVTVPEGAKPDAAIEDGGDNQGKEGTEPDQITPPVAQEDPETGNIVVEAGTFAHPEVKGYMFRIVEPATIVSDGHAMTIRAEMPSASYSHLFVGTAEQAGDKSLEDGVADGSFIAAEAAENAQGATVSFFTFPLETLDRDISICLYSVKNQHWVDQTIQFSSDSLSWMQSPEIEQQAQAVIGQLENLPARNTIVPDDSEHEAIVRAARDAYESLSRLQKSWVASRLLLLLEWDESMFDLGFNTEELPLALVGQKYDGALYVSGKNGDAGKSIRVIDGELPAGITLEMDSAGLWAQFVGTPQQAGTYAFTAEIANGVATASKQFTLHVGYAPFILTESAAEATKGVAYQQVFEADAYPDATWSLSAGKLPAGLAFADDGEDANTARITGTPTETGTFEFTLACDNFANGVESKSYTLNVLENTAGEDVKALQAELDGFKAVIARLNSEIEAIKAQLPVAVVINAKTVSAKTVKAALKKARNPYAATVTLGPKVKRIKKGAFAGTDVNELVIESSKLSKKRVKGALKGSKVKTVKVSVASKNLKKVRKAYKKAFAKKNSGRKVKLSF